MRDDRKEMNNENLQRLRKEIDSLDEELLRALAKRFEKVQEMRKVKKAAELPALDEKRWQEVVKSRLATAKALGLPPRLTKELLAIIHEHSLEIEA